MGILGRADARRYQAETDLSLWRTNEGWSLANPMSTSGIYVTADGVMRIAAAQACVRVLAETIAQLPLQIFEWMNHDDRQIARMHPLYDVLHDQPNSWQTAFEWREMMMGHAVLRGAAYSKILPGPRGAIDQLIPLHPDRTIVEQLPNRRLVFHYTTKQGIRETYSQEEVFYLRGLSDDGIVGLRQLDLGRDVFGTAIATERYGSSMYKNGAQLGGILRKKSPGGLSPTAKLNITEDLRKFTGSGNAFKTMVIEEDLEWTQVGMRARDAEFILSRKFSVIDICRMFRIPPHMIQDLERSTNNNIEHQSIEFVVYTLGPWLVRWEQAIRRDLILAYDRLKYFAEFNVDGLLRGDIVSRYTAYGTGIEKGFLTRNEVRRKENMNPLSGLDTPLVPMNMTDGSNAPADPANTEAIARAEYRSNQFLKRSAEKLAIKEVVAVRKAITKHQGDGLVAWLDQFYTGFAAELSKGLIIPFAIAEEFAIEARRHLISAGNNAAQIIDLWEKTRAATLITLGLLKGEEDA